MFDKLKKNWLEALRDPARAPSHALMLTETKSPWGWRESLQPSALAVDTDGNAAVLIGPDVNEGSNATYRKLEVPEEEILIVEQLDYWYEEANQGDLTDAINAALLKLEVQDTIDRRLPQFKIDRFARGSSVLRFGKLPLGWVLPHKHNLKFTLTPNGASGGSFNVYVDLLIRHEPLWLMQEAGLVDARSP